MTAFLLVVGAMEISVCVCVRACVRVFVWVFGSRPDRFVSLNLI
jgi:hypothetical protein